MPRRGSPKTAKATRDRRAVLDSLDGAEAKRLLGTLIDAHPDLLVEVAALTDEQLGAVTAESMAEEVAFALEGLSVEDIWERAGSHADGSYVEPTEAAWEVVEETLAPFLADLARRVALGRTAEATVICQGVLLALYRVSDGNGEFLEGHAPDTLEGAAVGTVEVWRTGRRGRARSGGQAREVAAMRSFVSNALPKWRSFLSRALGRAPATRSDTRSKRG